VATIGFFRGKGERGEWLVLMRPGSVRAVPGLGVGRDKDTELGREARALCRLLRKWFAFWYAVEGCSGVAFLAKRRCQPDTLGQDVAKYLVVCVAVVSSSSSLVSLSLDSSSLEAGRILQVLVTAVIFVPPRRIGSFGGRRIATATG
jgi:hypothetical protein